MIQDAVAKAAPAIADRIAAAHTILIFSHINPDGDAIGSMLGTWHVLRALGKHATPIASSEIPSYTQWLPGADQICTYAPGTALPEADLVIMVDIATMARIGAIYDDHASTLAQLPLIVIDHHLTNDGAGSIDLIVPESAATCEVLYHLFRAIGAPIDPDAATCLLLGLTTDTLSFQTSSTNPSALHTAADLLAHGADHGRVVEQVYYAIPSSSMMLLGKALAEMHCVDGLAWTTVTQEMLQATGAEDDSVDEVVRAMQRIAGVRALVLFKEREDGMTKISLRSRPPHNVAQLAQRWGGGGHAQAAGATIEATPQVAAEEVLPALRALIDSQIAR